MSASRILVQADDQPAGRGGQIDARPLGEPLDELRAVPSRADQHGQGA